MSDVVYMALMTQCIDGNRIVEWVTQLVANWRVED